MKDELQINLNPDTYRGFDAEVSRDDEGYHGILEVIRLRDDAPEDLDFLMTDYVDFHSDDEDGIEKEFRSAVDDYIDYCREIEKPLPPGCG